MNLHSIQQNITIPIQIMDQTVYLYIEQVEPAPLSRIVHGEVTVEFINMFEADENPVEAMDECKEIEEEDEVEELTPEARRQQVRDSWLKRFS